MRYVNVDGRNEGVGESCDEMLRKFCAKFSSVMIDKLSMTGPDRIENFVLFLNADRVGLLWNFGAK